jgi:hypothetical protein
MAVPASGGVEAAFYRRNYSDFTFICQAGASFDAPAFLQEGILARKNPQTVPE